MGETISSAQNPRIQLVQKLMNQAKARAREGLFAVEGARLVEDGLRSGFTPEFILKRKHASPRALSVLEGLRDGVQVLETEDKLFDSLADTENSQGLIAVFKAQDLPLPDHLDFLLIPDQVRDPGNLGTMLRTAEAAGIQALLLPPGTADPWSPKVLRAGMGAHFRLPIYQWNWLAISTLLEGFKVFAADMAGALSFWEADFTQKTALLIGSEAEGISPEAQAYVTQTLRIPMASGTESLNAAVSAAVMAFEVSRQRRQIKRN